jgi:chitodextrinase
MQIITAAPVTSSTINNYVTNEIQQVTGPHGTPTYALFQNLKVNTAAGPKWSASQDPLLITRDNASSGSQKTDVTNMYYTYWFMLQPNLVAALGTDSNTAWRVMSEFKTGGEIINNSVTWGGDYRTITLIGKNQSTGQLYWHTQADTVANGSVPLQTFWSTNNTSVPVPVGEWFKYEVFWHRSSGSDGRYWAAVNGQVIVDHNGPNMGAKNLPIDRIFLNNNYGGTIGQQQQWTTGIEIWDGFPCGVGVSCYGIDSIAPSVPAALSATSGSPNLAYLAWTASTDNTGVSGYRIYRNGIQIGTSAVASFTDSSVVGGTTYSYTVKASDAAGNLSASSNIATVTTPAAVSISSYNAGNITANSAQINWTTNAPSTGVVSYGISATNLSSIVNANNLVTSQSVPITGLSSGIPYYFKISAGSSFVTSNFSTLPISSPVTNIAASSSVTASSQNTGTNQQAIKAIDGIIGGYPGQYTVEWATIGQKAGAWIQLNWNKTYTVNQVVLYDRPNIWDQITGATLTFSNGSSVKVGSLDNLGGAVAVNFPAVITNSVRVTVNTVSGSTSNVGLAELKVFGF